MSVEITFFVSFLAAGRLLKLVCKGVIDDGMLLLSQIVVDSFEKASFASCLLLLIEDTRVVVLLLLLIKLGEELSSFFACCCDIVDELNKGVDCTEFVIGGFWNKLLLSLKDWVTLIEDAVEELDVDSEEVFVEVRFAVVL